MDAGDALPASGRLFQGSGFWSRLGGEYGGVSVARHQPIRNLGRGLEGYSGGFLAKNRIYFPMGNMGPVFLYPL
jgi:hypothetical protein